MRLFLNWYYRSLLVALTSLLALIMVPVALKLFSRHAGFESLYIWADEVSRFYLIWIILLGAAIALRDESLISIKILPSLGKNIDRALRLSLLILMTVAGAVFTYGGWLFAQYGAQQYAELAGLPLTAILIAWPVLGVSWLLFMAEKLYDFFRLVTKGDGLGSV